MLDKCTKAKYTIGMIKLYRNAKQFDNGKEYLLDTANDNKPAEFETKEEIFAVFQGEGHPINSIEDLVSMGVHFETTAE